MPVIQGSAAVGDDGHVAPRLPQVAALAAAPPLPLRLRAAMAPGLGLRLCRRCLTRGGGATDRAVCGQAAASPSPSSFFYLAIFHLLSAGGA